MINGVTQVVMTKADVLDSFEELKMCTSYSVNGKEKREIPFQISKIKIDPVYQLFRGWNSNTTSGKVKNDLPSAMIDYVQYINEFIEVGVKYVSNGPGREQIVQL